MHKTIITPKKRLDLELSIYLACCLAIFFIVAIAGIVILTQHDQKQLTLSFDRNSQLMMSQFESNLSANISNENKKDILIHTTQFRDAILKTINAHKKNYNLLIFVVALFTIFILILFLFVSGWIQTRFFEPISTLITISTKNDALEKLSNLKINSINLEILRKLFLELVASRIQKQQQEKQLAELEKNSAVANVAAQVAHDIRSPLAALAVLETDLATLPEDKRILMRSAMTRIRDIANNLLERKRDIQTDSAENIPIPQLIFALIEQIIAEKRMQYRSKFNIEINDQFDFTHYGLFALVQPVELKRVISNLINNAIEALDHGGNINLKLSNNASHIQIVITDNGKGINEKILPRLMQKGETYGKENGSGLGLYHARQTLERWNGKIEIKSTERKGTTVTITLPRVTSPNWFLEKITLYHPMKIIVVDDDASIHQIWQNRFSSFEKIEILHFSSPTEFLSYPSISVSHGNILYLFDYEFLGHKENGLDLIEQAEIANKSILVTSQFEAMHIRNRAEKLGVKIIPKAVAGFVPIELIENKENYDAILLDDDPLIRSAWEMVAKMKNKKMLSFSTIESLFNHFGKVNPTTAIYIDSNLGSEKKGEDVAEELYKLGFLNLHLATGYNPASINRKGFFKAITGKTPPW